MNIRKLEVRALTVSGLACAVIALFAALPVSSFAQDEMKVIDGSKIPAAADKMNDFVPAGWTIEERLRGDLTGSGKGDYVLKLIEDKLDTDKEGSATSISRALVIVTRGEDNRLHLAAVAGKLLQCPNCGGAFYGMMDAPANIKIENNVIIVEQDHGSRWVTDLTYRFRFEAATKKFLLIGFDFNSRDRTEGGTDTESTNYVTGERVVTHTKAKKAPVTTKTQITKTKIYIDQVDTEKFDEDATKRLGLG